MRLETRDFFSALGASVCLLALRELNLNMACLDDFRVGPVFY
ncbi:hypothetical protein [Desulfovibrio sp. G11]|nr:hypothetical protein [Desulfovibrio sp. G11]